GHAKTMKITASGVATSTLKYGSLVAGCLVIILPLLFIFFGSFKNDQEFYNTAVLQPPSNFGNFDNYSKAFTDGLMVQGFTNTTIILIFSCAGTIIIGTMTAYVL